MHKISFFFILSWVFITRWLYAQIPLSEIPNQTQYAAPVDFPILLSGNYGEIRATHFHTGIDIKTDQEEGRNILAADDGYVFRIVIQSKGYGKAIYLRHRSGQVTVYAHLRQFTPFVETYVKQNQYLLKSFEVDLYPEQDLFIFHKGELLGFSGNTGNSEAPHLHFEIRDQSSSIPLNALEYGFDIRDITKPGISTLAVYPLDRDSRVNNVFEKLLVQPLKKNGHYILPVNTIQVNGSIGFGVETYDFLDNSPNECGPLSISLFLDEKQIFLCRLDSIPFSQAGYVNSHIDYEERIRSKKKIQKLYIDPNNRLSIYKVAVNRGILRLTDISLHTVRIVIRDTYGNESFLTFNIQNSGLDTLPFDHEDDLAGTFIFRFDTLNVFEKEDIRIIVPRNALFDNIDFQYTRIKSDSCPWSMVHQVHNEFTPLFKPYILSIRPSYLPVFLQTKSFIASRGENGELISHDGEYKSGYITTKVKTFGQFFVDVDTLNPVITPVNFNAGQRYAGNQTISFRIVDLESGVRKYHGYIDKKWALFEYDAKNDLLNYSIDGDILKENQSHEIEILVTDNKDNVTHFSSNFFY